MRAFNNSQNPNQDSTGRSKSSCSYCRSDEHQVIDCPHAKSDWALFKAFTVPCSVADNWTNKPASRTLGQSHWGNQYTQAGWFKVPSGWSKWYAECEKAVAKIERAEERKANKKNKVKRASKCGFCGSPHHNRRACPSMDALNERLIRANAHWRKRFYDRIVSGLGLGNGALIKVARDEGSWQKPEIVERVGIVTSINFDEVNMQQGDTPFNDEHGRPLVDVWDVNYRSPDFVSVVSPTKQPLSDEWVSGGQQECVEFITKKYSLEVLTNKHVIGLLENYEKKFNLC